MGFFDNVERKLENVVGGGFARAFGSEVQPVEITARIQREMDASARPISGGRRLAPNDFTVALGPHDHDRLFPYSEGLTDEIIAEVRAYAAENGYVFAGPVAIEFTRDDSFPTGHFAVEARQVSTRGGRPVAQPPRSQALVLEVNGVRHPLTPPGFTIGRGADADLRVNDPSISRVHARIDVEGYGAERRLTITDLGSTNGVQVDGRAITTAELRQGSRIEIGNTRLLVRTPVSDV